MTGAVRQLKLRLDCNLANQFRVLKLSDSKARKMRKYSAPVMNNTENEFQIRDNHRRERKQICI